jgi:site-specific recombinase XerD
MIEKVKILVRAFLPMTLDDAIDTFLSSIIGIRSPNTVSWYANVLNYLHEYFDGNTNIKSIRLTDLEKWRASLYNRKVKYIGRTTHPEVEEHLSPFTIYGVVKSAKTFFKWLQVRQYILESPAANLEIPKKPGHTRFGINPDDMEKMIDTAKPNIRNLALVLFVKDTGCRRQGVASLKLSELQLNHPNSKLRYRVPVCEKGNKVRIVFMRNRSLHALLMWLEIRPQFAIPGEDAVFVSIGGHTPGRKLTPIGVTEIFREIARKAGVESAFSPHEWRHSFSRRLIAAGANLGQVSQLLGHSDIRTTMDFYGSLTVDQLQQAVDMQPEETIDFDY